MLGDCPQCGKRPPGRQCAASYTTGECLFTSEDLRRASFLITAYEGPGDPLAIKFATATTLAALPHAAGESTAPDNRKESGG